MSAPAERTDAHRPGRTLPNTLVQFSAVVALAASTGYLIWRLANIGANPWLSVPLWLVEVWGFVSLALLTLQAWRAPSLEPRVNDSGAPNIDVIVTCTFHSPDELERSLIGCRSLDGAGQILVVTRPDRPEILAVAATQGVRTVEHAGNHSDGFAAGLQRLHSSFALWVEAGQVPMPTLIRSMVGRFSDSSVAIVQSGVGLFNKDSFAHLSGGRDEDAFRHTVAYPNQSARGVAPWFGGGSIVRALALKSAGGLDSGDQAALQRSLVRMHRDGWKSRYHAGDELIRTDAPDTLDAYLRLRRRRAIESLRVFRTPENPVISSGLSLTQRVLHVALAAAYGHGLRQLLLALILVATLFSGALPFGGSATTWALLWLPSLATSVIARRCLSRGTMAVGDWTRQGWRTMGADISAISSLVSARLTKSDFSQRDRSGFQALGRLRGLTALLLLVDVALITRGLSIIWPRILPRFTTSGRVFALAIGLLAAASILDVLQVAVRRQQRRSQFRLSTDLQAIVGAQKVQVV